MMKHIPNDLLIFYFTFANTKIHSYFLCAIMNNLKSATIIQYTIKGRFMSR